MIVPVFGSMILTAVLAGMALAGFYWSKTMWGFTTDQALLVSLIYVVCIIGGWVCHK